jgi:hypothetical protein
MKANLCVIARGSVHDSPLSVDTIINIGLSPDPSIPPMKKTYNLLPFVDIKMLLILGRGKRAVSVTIDLIGSQLEPPFVDLVNGNFNPPLSKTKWMVSPCVTILGV